MLILYKSAPHYVLETVDDCKLKNYKGSLSLLVNCETWMKDIGDITGSHSDMYNNDILSKFIFLTQFAQSHGDPSEPYTKYYLHFTYKGSQRKTCEILKIKKDGMLCIDEGDGQIKLFKFEHCDFLDASSISYY